MDKKTYMERFSKLVRWRLSPEEAEDVIADYTELLSIHPEDGTALVKTLGDPSLAVKLLGATKEYLHWMIVFSILCICLFYCGIGLFDIGHYIYFAGRFYNFGELLFYISIGLTSFWKQRCPKGKYRKCPGLAPAMLWLLIPAAVMTAILVFFCIILLMMANDYPFEPHQFEWFSPVTIAFLRLSGIASFIAALKGLLNSRIQDRRWFAIFAMAFTILITCMLLIHLIRSLSEPLAAFMALKAQIPSVIIGTAGVIWSLC